MKAHAIYAAVGATLLTASLGATAAQAAEPTPPIGFQTAVIAGHLYGPKDGLRIVTESHEVTPGGGQVGTTWVTPPKGMSTQAVWGTSFAYSKEILQLEYMAYAKAAANVFSGLRIVQVCFWYTRGGVRLIPNTCSSASFNGGWNQGAEVNRGVSDTLDPNAPQTIFNISTYRIDPTSHGD